MASEQVWAEAVYWAVWAGTQESVSVEVGPRWVGKVTGAEARDLPGCVAVQKLVGVFHGSL